MLHISKYAHVSVSNKLISSVANVTDEEMQEHFDNFFEDVFVELEDKVNL